jgi:hypothetical protein
MAQLAVRRQQPEADETTPPQVAEIRYQNTIAQGNSRNVYGNVINTYYVGPQQAAPTAPESAPNAPASFVEDIESILTHLEFEGMDDRLATLATAHSTTCEWLFQTAGYTAWRDLDALKTNRGFLWLKGKPGAGKSTLMKSALRHGEREHRDLAISFFFNARGMGLQKSLQGMCRSLLHQLLGQRMKQLAALSTRDGKLLEGVLEVSPHRRNRSAPQAWPIELLEDMLRELMIAFSPARVACHADASIGTVDDDASKAQRNAVLALAQTHVTCYVDALDECEDDEARDVIELLGLLRATAIKAGVGFRVLLSSRHYPHISFDACQKMILEGKEGHEADIAEYIHSKLRIANSKLAHEIELGIQARASGVFLWVVLVVRIMNDLYDRGQVRRLRQQLDGIPTGLHQLFKTILQQDIKDRDELLLVLQWILFSERPLTLEEFYHAVTGTLESDNGIEDHEQDIVSMDDMLRFLLDVSRGLAEMTKSNFPTIQFIHESVKDYLLDAGLVTLEPSLGTNVFGHCHARLQQCCRCYLERVQIAISPRLADADALQIPAPDVSVPEGSFEPALISMWDAQDTYSLLEYAVESMLYHAESAHLQDSSLCDFVAAFPHDLWRKFYNLLNPKSRLSVEASLLYILVLEGALKLTETYIKAKEIPRQWLKQVLPEHHRSFLGPAVDNGDEAMVKMLLGHGIGANWPAKMDHTCLSLAVQKEDNRTVQMLIDAGATADPRANHPWGSAELGHCLQRTNEEVAVKVLMSDVYTSRWHEDFNWILWSAKDRVKQVLISRLRISVKEAEDDGPAVPNDSSPRLALLAACICNLPDMIAPLAKHGTDLNVKFGWNTGLFIATERCYTMVVQSLLALGADPNIPKDFGRYPIHEAADGGNDQILRMLLESGANASVADRGQSRPLHIAARLGRTTAVKLLIEHGADIHAVDNDGYDALVEASSCGRMDVVDVLLKAGGGASAEQLDKAADLASRGEHQHVLQRLLEKGAKKPRDPLRIQALPPTPPPCFSASDKDAVRKHRFPQARRGILKSKSRYDTHDHADTTQVPMPDQCPAVASDEILVVVPSDAAQASSMVHEECEKSTTQT